METRRRWGKQVIISTHHWKWGSKDRNSGSLQGQCCVLGGSPARRKGERKKEIKHTLSTPPQLPPPQPPPLSSLVQAPRKCRRIYTDKVTFGGPRTAGSAGGQSGCSSRRHHYPQFHRLKPKEDRKARVRVGAGSKCWDVQIFVTCTHPITCRAILFWFQAAKLRVWMAATRAAPSTTVQYV